MYINKYIIYTCMKRTRNDINSSCLDTYILCMYIYTYRRRRGARGAEGGIDWGRDTSGYYTKPQKTIQSPNKLNNNTKYGPNVNKYCQNISFSKMHV